MRADLSPGSRLVVASFRKTLYKARQITITVEENTMGKGNNAQRKEVKKKKAKKDKPKPTSR